jgi:hypothetical protein
MTNAPMIDGTAEFDVPSVDSPHMRIIAEAVAVIDLALSQMVRRELVSSAEVSDLLLDVRNLLGSAGKATH